MRGFPAIILGLPLCAGGCTAALERQVADLHRQVRELTRLSASAQVRQEEMANRLLLVEDEAARRRVAAIGTTTKTDAKSGSSATTDDRPVPGTAQAERTVPGTTARSDMTAKGVSAKGDTFVLSSPEDEPELPVVKVNPRERDSDDGRSRDVLGSVEPSPAPSVASAPRAIVTASDTPAAATPAAAAAPASGAQRSLDDEAAALPEPPRLSPKRLYASGLAAFRAGELARSRRVFLAVLKRFPEHSLADNALYWSGRAHAAINDHRAAAATFETLLERYPTGNKVPDALLALAASLHASGRATDSRARLELLAKTFPATTAAKQARVRLREMMK